MIFEEKTVGNVLVVEMLEPRLDARVATAFKKQLYELINEGNHSIVIVLNKINFIDSSGLGAIVSCLKHLGRRGDLVLSGSQDHVNRLFRLTAMARVFRMFATEEEAVKALTKEPPAPPAPAKATTAAEDAKPAAQAETTADTPAETPAEAEAAESAAATAAR